MITHWASQFSQFTKFSLMIHHHLIFTYLAHKWDRSERDGTRESKPKSEWMIKKLIWSDFLSSDFYLFCSSNCARVSPENVEEDAEEEDENIKKSRERSIQNRTHALHLNFNESIVGGWNMKRETVQARPVLSSRHSTQRRRLLVHKPWN